LDRPTDNHHASAVWYSSEHYENASTSQTWEKAGAGFAGGGDVADHRGAEENTAAAATTAPPKSTLRNVLRSDSAGDWGGLRTDCRNTGWTLIFYIMPTRGTFPAASRRARLRGGAVDAVGLDSQKLAGYDGGHFHAGGVWLHGQDHFSDEHIGRLE